MSWSQILREKKNRWRYQQMHTQYKGLFFPKIWPIFAVSSYSGREEQAQLGFFHKGTDPIHEGSILIT